MDPFLSQIVFLVLSILGAVYIFRKNFGGVDQKLGNFFVPRPVITTVLSIFTGFVFWFVLNLVLFRFYP